MARKWEQLLTMKLVQSFKTGSRSYGESLTMTMQSWVGSRARERYDAGELYSISIEYKEFTGCAGEVLAH